MSELLMLSKKQFNRIKPYFPLSHGVAQGNRAMRGVDRRLIAKVTGRD